jgi:hypothetical protein
MSALDMYTSGTQIGAVEIGAKGPRVRTTGGNIQRIMAGIPRLSIPMSGTLEVPVSVSEPFRPERIVLSVAAQALDINNIRIGTKSLNVTSYPISGNCFSEQAIGTHVVGYTAQAGVGFVISASNPNAAAAVVIGGGVFGLAIN